MNDRYRTRRQEILEPLATDTGGAMNDRRYWRLAGGAKSDRQILEPLEQQIPEPQDETTDTGAMTNNRYRSHERQPMEPRTTAGDDTGATSNSYWSNSHHHHGSHKRSTDTGDTTT